MTGHRSAAVASLSQHACPGAGCPVCGCVAERTTSAFVVEGYSLEPDYSMGGHAHPQSGLAVVLDGTFDVASARQDYRVGPGQAVVLPARVAHCERSEPGSRCLLVKLRRQPRLEGLDRAVAEMCVLESPELSSAAGRLARELDLGDSDGLALDSLASELFLEIQGLLDLPMLRTRRPAWIGRVAEVLSEGWRDPPSLASLGRMVGVSPPHLARSFRRVTGCTIGDFRRRQRLIRTARLLRRAELSLSAVAYEAGFADQSHMTRQFRHYLGATPRWLRMRESHGRA